MKEIGDFIGQVGFPIFVCIWLLLDRRKHMGLFEGLRSVLVDILEQGNGKKLKDVGKEQE